MRSWVVFSLSIILLTSSWVSQAEEPPTPPAEEPLQLSSEQTKFVPLFNRVGGSQTLVTLVRYFVEFLLKDERLADNQAFQDRVFKLSRKSHQKSMVRLLCNLSGGPCDPDEKTLRETHQEISFSRSSWDHVVHDFVKALSKLNLAPADRKELLAILESIKLEIMYRKR